jgi:NADPH:quinone reductase-like Zn-dependent oxidoreductase
MTGLHVPAGGGMAAAVIGRAGGEPSISTVPGPLRAAGEALIELAAAAINPVDLSIARGGYLPGAEPDFPLVPGQEGVGRVLEAATLDPGTRVWFFTGRLFGPGSFAQRVSVSEDNVIPVPDDLTDAQAASLGISALTGWLAVQWRGQLQPRETVLVLGATGTVGAVAVQAARVLGAAPVVAAGRDQPALGRLRELGAETVDLSPVRTAGQLAAVLAGATGGGADLTIDPLWGQAGQAAVEAAGFGGRIIQLGQSAGATSELASIAVRGRMLSILGFTIWAVPHQAKTGAYRAMASELAAGRLHVDHETVPLAQIAAAWRRQERSPHRKLILIP